MECVIWGRRMVVCACDGVPGVCVIAAVCYRDYKGNDCFDWLLILEDVAQMHDSASVCVCLYLCVCVTNWRKINRCEEEQTDTLLSEVAEVMGKERGGMWIHTHTYLTNPFHFKRSRWLHTCSRPSYFVKRHEPDCHITANKELRESLKNNRIE